LQAGFRNDNFALCLCERGATNGQLARFFNVSVSTIWLWRLANEDFSNAVQLGKKVADDRIEQALFDRAAGYDYDTVKVFRGEDGKPVISDLPLHILRNLKAPQRLDLPLRRAVPDRVPASMHARTTASNSPRKTSPSRKRP
jgi:hypothetical protein